MNKKKRKKKTATLKGSLKYHVSYIIFWTRNVILSSVCLLLKQLSIHLEDILGYIKVAFHRKKDIIKTNRNT